MPSLISQIEGQLRDPDRTQELIVRVQRREERLADLARQDLDWQLLQSDGRTAQAQSVFHHITHLEQELGLS